MRETGFAIDSVLNQSYANIEIICVNDGSKDNTTELLESYGKKIMVVYQTNQGQPAARNKGISEAKGKYIAFLDADDLWKPQKIEKQVRVLEASPELILPHTDIAFINEKGRWDSRCKLDYCC